MEYSKGDVVKFKLESGEVEEGNVQYIETGHNEKILYINSFSRWAYKVSEKRVIARIQGKRR